MKRADLELTGDMIDFALREVVTPSRRQSIINAQADEVLYTNAVKFALRLVVDMISSVQLSGTKRSY